MANRLYDKGREAFLNADIDWAADTIKVVFVDGQEYTPDTATDEFLDDIAGGGVIATSGALQNKTSTNGVADADDIEVAGVTGDQFEFMVVFKDTGSAATSRLIALFDTATGLPFTPSGAGVLIRWDSGANKIFKL